MRTLKEIRREEFEQNGCRADIMSGIAVFADSVASCPSIAKQLQVDRYLLMCEARVHGTLYGAWDEIDATIEKEVGAAINKLVNTLERYKKELTLDQIALLLINENSPASQCAGHALRWALARRHHRKQR